MTQQLKQLTMTVLWTLYAGACKAGKTLKEFYADDIEGKFSISENSLSSKISNGKKDLEIGASTWNYQTGVNDKGEPIFQEMTGSALRLLKRADGKRVFEKMTDIPEVCECVKAADMSKFPTLKDSGRGRQAQVIDHGALLNDLLSVDAPAETPAETPAEETETKSSKKSK